MDLLGISSEPLAGNSELLQERREWLYAAWRHDVLHAIVWAVGWPTSVLHVIPYLRTAAARQGGAELNALQDLLSETLAIVARENQFRLAQCMLADEEVTLRQALRSVGFQCVAELDVLLATSQAWPTVTVERIDATFVAVEADESLAKLFAETLVESHDCPRLGEWRSPSDLFTSLTQGGPMNPTGHRRDWYRVDVLGRTVGLFLLDRAADAESPVALEYLGIVPGDRGHGVGTEVVAKIVRRHVQQGLATLVAVDQQNGPAQRVYSKSGFRAISQQSILLRNV